MKKLITLVAVIGACSASNPVVRHPVRQAVPETPVQEMPQRSEELHWWGYRVVDGNISYEHNTRTYECTLTLGNDARIEDMWCDSTVDQIEDGQGFQSCYYNPGTSRCNLANQIFEKKKEFLRVQETHQRWLETGGDDVLRDYLD